MTFRSGLRRLFRAEIQPHGVADDLGGKPMALVAGASGGRHSTRLLISVSQPNPAGHAKLTLPRRVPQLPRRVPHGILTRLGRSAESPF
jgi:hypothetical protein